MGKHGPPSSHPTGVGHTTLAGYHRLTMWDPATKTFRAVMAHVTAWEKEHGPIPAGHSLHHINGDRQDNRLENLQLVDSTTHKRLHGGCELRDGQWWKPCKLCGEHKPITADHWYLSKEGYPLYGRCRPCHIAKVVVDKRARKARQLQAAV